MAPGTTHLLLRIAAILWVVWGLVHMLAGFVIMSSDTPGAVAAVADAIDPDTLKGPYPDAAGALINQHGFNLFWIGATTLICAVLMWRRSINAIFIAALVGGLADLGYFIFLDLGGFVKFVPGTVMTLVSSSAIILSFWAYFKGLKGGAPEA